MAAYRSLGIAVLVFLAAGTAVAQDGKGSFRTVDPILVPYDQPDTWTLHFGYYPPRIVELDVPGRGKQQVWYMLYQVWNKTPSPQRIVPEFELVTKDPDLPGSFLDEQLPSVVKQIAKIEDPNNILNIQTSTSIFKNKIPVTPIDSIPNTVTGVAVWTSVSAKAAKTNKFSVYVSGLSNGLVEVDAADGAKVVRRKTLQLDFIKPTDDRNVRIDDVKPDDNNGLGGENWYYRAASRKAAKVEEKK